MKLLFDQNLSFRLPALLADRFPELNQVRLLGLDRADDLAIWNVARAEGFALVSLDFRFHQFAATFGSPPKVIWLRCGNRPTVEIQRLILEHADLIEAFARRDDASCLELYETDPVLSECPSAFSGAMTSRTACFSSVISGKRPSSFRDQTGRPVGGAR